MHLTDIIFMSLLVGMLNMIGGRFDDVYGMSKFPSRLFFRCIFPGVIASLFAHVAGLPIWDCLYVQFAVTAGSALWFPWGWSFDEITGQYDPAKYPHWIQAIGVHLFPVDNMASTNRRRGIVMKGLRGLFDILTFALLAYVHPLAGFLWPLTFAQGVIYWLCGKFSPAGHAVWFGELVYGMWRGALIAIAIAGV